jgi:hypothetical protein
MSSVQSERQEAIGRRRSSGAVNIMRSSEVLRFGSEQHAACADSAFRSVSGIGTDGLYRGSGIWYVWSRYQPRYPGTMAVATGRSFGFDQMVFEVVDLGGMEVGATVLATSHDGRRFRFCPSSWGRSQVVGINAVSDSADGSHPLENFWIRARRSVCALNDR